MPSGQVDGEWQGGTTLHSDMLRLVDDKFGCMVGQSWIKSALRWGMVELEEMDEDEEDLSGVTKVHAKIFENNTLHVGNIDLKEASEVALKALFSGFGHVVQVTVRVRKEPELSWALITMLTEASVSKITNLKIEAGGKILKTRLVEMHKAKASTGSLKGVWNISRKKALYNLPSMQEFVDASMFTAAAAATEADIASTLKRLLYDMKMVSERQDDLQAIFADNQSKLVDLQSSTIRTPVKDNSSKVGHHLPDHSLAL